MPLRVTFDLSDADLDYFRGVIREAHERAKDRPEKELVAAARKLLDTLRSAEIPEFMRKRLVALEALIAMLEDAEWELVGEDRERVRLAMAYFAEPLDLIPDSVPGLGLLDDAVMVELVVRELRHEVDAYLDFCQYRDAGQGRQESALSREQWLTTKRRQLFLRMRRRRSERPRHSGGLYS